MDCVQVAFVVTGKGKAFTLERIFERPALPGALPAQMVRPMKSETMWFVDREAASELRLEEWGNAKKYPFLDYGHYEDGNGI